MARLARCALTGTGATPEPSIDGAALFDLGFEDSPIGVCLLGSDGRILRANPALCEILGRVPSELDGRAWRSIVHADDVPASQAQLGRLQRGEVATATVERRLQRSDGADVTAQVTGSILRGADGATDVVLLQVVDVSLRRAAEARLTEAALNDALTGLANRRLLLERCAHALTRTARNETGLAVLFLDLDRFKVVNDSKGHAAGDDLLRAVADRLRHAVRPSDTVARLGGDEFVVLCEDVSGGDEAEFIARRLLLGLSRPVDVVGREVVVTASCGIALGTHGDTPDGLLRDADTAMYQAKEQGRNRAVLFDASLRAAADERLDVEADLRHALGGRQLRVWFQPQWSLTDDSLTGVEALVRWEHPDRGLLAPAAFLAVAEETGLIRDIGTFVLEAACGEARRWLDARPDLVISVNLSARQLDTPGFAALVANVLAHHGVPAANLCFEVTETVLMDIGGAAAGQLGQLRGLGTHLALDDFGTGWSSLSHLTTFPVDVVKVDRSFVADLDDGHSRGAAVVAAVIGLAHSLGLEAIAEGAETQAHVDRLRALGCDGVQGYQLGRPVPAGEIDVLVGASA